MRSRPIITIGLLALLLGAVALWLYPRGEVTPPAAEAAAPQPDPQPAPQSAPAAEQPDSGQLIVPVGPDGNAVPQRSGAVSPAPKMPAPSPLRRLALQATPMDAVFRPSQSRDMIILARGPAPGKGPVKLEPIGPGMHTIPPAGGNGNYGAGPGGGQSSGNSDGAMIWQPDGSFDSYDKGGHYHLNPPSGDGSVSGWFEDKSGQRTEFSGDSDGNIFTRHPDGTVEKIDKDGNSTIDLDGLMPTTTGPGGEGSEEGGGGPGPGGKSGSGIGEPHFLTADGTAFMTQAVGEFTLATGIPGQELQLRTAPWKESRAVSAVTGFAIRAGGAVIQILADGSVRVDGQLVDINGPSLRYNLPEGGALGLWSEGGTLTHAVLIWPDLSTLWVDLHGSFLNFSVKWRRADAAREGLLGLDDGVPENDLTGPDGNIADRSDPSAVAAYVNAWRLSDEASLFSYEADQSTADFTDTGFPYEAAPGQHSDLAESLCAGLTHDFTRSACLFDVTATGDGTFASASRLLDMRLSREAPSAPAASPVASPVAAVGVDAPCRASDDDIATAISGNDYVTVTTTAETPALFRLTTKGGIIIQTRLDTANSGPWVEGQPGYCVFDESGATMIPPTSSGTDSYFSRNDQATIPAGTYYLRVWGNGESRLAISQNP